MPEMRETSTISALTAQLQAALEREKGLHKRIKASREEARTYLAVMQRLASLATERECTINDLADLLETRDDFTSQLERLRDLLALEHNTGASDATVLDEACSKLEHYQRNEADARALSRRLLEVTQWSGDIERHARMIVEIIEHEKGK